MADGKERKIELPPGKLVYQQLDTPKAWADGDTPMYSLTVAWPVAVYEDKTPGSAFLRVKQAVHGVAKDAWGDRANVKRDGAPPYQTKFRYGADNDKNPDQFRDYVLATFSSKYAVPVYELHADADPTKFDPTDLRKGMEVIVASKAKAWTGNGRGVTMYPYGVAISNSVPDVDFNERTARAEDKEGESHFAGRRADNAGDRAKADAADRDANDDAQQDPGDHKRGSDTSAPADAEDSDDIPF